jgi:hypothetical protein
MTAAAGGEHDRLERSVDRFLHGRRPEDGGGLFQQVVVDVNQSLAHGCSISVALSNGYTPRRVRLGGCQSPGVSLEG